MRKIFLTHVLFLVFTSLYSQDWQMFVKDQTSYCKQQSDISINVESFLFDSLVSFTDYEIMYFNRKSELSDECYSNLLDDSGMLNWWLSPDKIDSLVLKGDSVLFISDYYTAMDTFIFMPFSDVGESWVTNDISIECISNDYIDILGTQDSIKIFECSGSSFSGIQFVLSKSFGLVKFIPLNDFFLSSSSIAHTYFELLGYKIGVEKIGYTHPDFSEYFHLHEGDILFWKHISFDWEPPYLNLASYHIDTVLYAYHSVDSVHYNIRRTNYGSNGEISLSSVFNEYYLRKDEGKILSNQTSWFGILNNGSFEQEVFLFKGLGLEIINGDTITNAQYEIIGLYIDTSTCIVGQVLDYDYTKIYSTREGYVFNASYSWGESSSTLIGSIINGVENGETTLPIGIEELSQKDILVYPNPVNDVLNIESKLNSIISIEIYEMTGKLLLLQDFEENIDISTLSHGVYLLVLYDENKASHRLKFIKE